MKKSFLAVLTIGLLTIVSCSTDIEINAPAEDITVVYGMIDPLDSIHYIKINKAFLGDVSALDLAADANNFNYAAGDIDVFIDEYDANQGITINSYQLTRTDSIPKDAGVFDNSSNVLYAFIEPNINRLHTYKLTVNNKVLNKTIKAETEIIGSSTIPSSVTGGKFNFWIGPVIPGDHFNDKTISIATGKDIGRADATLILNYNEYYTTASGLPMISKSVRMPLGERMGTSVIGNESLEWKLKGTSFFDNVKNNVSNPVDVPFFSHRELRNISLEFNVAGTELSTFMSVNAPSNTLNQDRPQYTNITNGIGIFSARTVMLWSSTLDIDTSHQGNIHNNTISYLQSLNLGFCFGDISWTNFPVAPCTQLP